MSNTHRWTRLSIAVLAIVSIGCASTGTSKTIAQSDLPALAGTWAGSLTPPALGATPGTLTLSPNGDYIARAGAFSAQGKAEVKDGALMLTSTSMSGGMATGQRTSTATLSERSDGTMLLTGFGHSDSGPFNFEVSRRR